MLCLHPVLDRYLSVKLSFFRMAYFLNLTVANLFSDSVQSISGLV
jgi:hypothetical protein